MPAAIAYSTEDPAGSLIARLLVEGHGFVPTGGEENGLPDHEREGVRLVAYSSVASHDVQT